MASSLIRTVFCIAALLFHEARGANHIIAPTSSNAKRWECCDPYSNLAVETGDTLTFEYSTNHDVMKMSDNTCGATGNTELGNNAVGGGSGNYPNKYMYTVTQADEAAGTIYFACSYTGIGTYTHCTGGQKITVTVAAPASTSPNPSTSSGSPNTNTNNAKTLSIGVAMGGLVVQAFASLAA
mmetsp:Transcript_74906/g.118413  ORF Transcript_74906/g.118413 Transcript_74906/m.118413 type:complete len:182 (+) Transcript_74906:80-625(+)